MSLTINTTRPQDWIGKIVGRYQLQEYLGGGMSDVYRARDTGVLGKTVAVKILKAENSSDEASKERFLLEAKTAASISHENILSVYEYGQEHQRPFMVMEFLGGESLRTAIEEHRTGDLQYKLKIALDISTALEHVHAKKIVHRDIKPDNIQISPSGAVKLIDFGIAKSEAFKLGLTQAGFSVGTIYYMSPEQLLGKEVTHLADVYAFGILMYELLTGTKPITGNGLDEISSRILHQPVDVESLRLAGVPEPLVELIRACTAKKSEERPQSFSEIRRRLMEIIKELDGQKNNRKYTAVVASAVVFLLSLALVAYVVKDYHRDYHHGPDPPPPPPPSITTDSGEMLLIPAGEFLSGPNKEKAELPAYYIDRTEVTNAAYGKYCRENKNCPPDFEQQPPDFPVVNITIAEARAFAMWAGQRLPTMKEWEKAARGTDGRQYPWGDDDRPGAANVAHPDHKPPAVLVAADSFPQGDSPFKVRQMAGNVWELIDELRKPTSENIRDFEQLKFKVTAGDPWYLTAGASFSTPLPQGAAFESSLIPGSYKDVDIGFRCVKDTPKKQ